MSAAANGSTRTRRFNGEARGEGTEFEARLDDVSCDCSRPTSHDEFAAASGSTSSHTRGDVLANAEGEDRSERRVAAAAPTGLADSGNCRSSQTFHPSGVTHSGPRRPMEQAETTGRDLRVWTSSGFDGRVRRRIGRIPRLKPFASSHQPPFAEPDEAQKRRKRPKARPLPMISVRPDNSRRTPVPAGVAGRRKASRRPALTPSEVSRNSARRSGGLLCGRLLLRHLLRGFLGRLLRDFLGCLLRCFLLGHRRTS